ncbi:hypothetical protein niasHT_006498 [Heterodera trifolii]|uniref:ShKT domain-containing protein n=1 Tax=Heterodera trifolii TaxID=157864 RepID=A0ABD2LTV8_9BILA
MFRCPFLLIVLNLSIALLCFLLRLLPSTSAQRLDRCFDGTNFLPSAQSCTDEADPLTTQSPTVTAMPICEAFFDTEPTATDVTADTHPCYVPDNKPMASKCRRRCKTCCLLPKYGSCEDQQSAQATTPQMPCNPSLCSVEKFAVKVCPRTCGRCVDYLRSMEQTKYCDDTENVDNCMMLKESGLCASADAAEMCALTCNDPANNQLCEQYTHKVSAAVTAMTGQPGGAAARANGDLSDDCPSNKNLCNNEVYKEMMHRYCIGTCAEAEAGECEDRSENCVHWKRNGFCENEFYTLEIRTNQCGATCGLC